MTEDLNPAAKALLKIVATSSSKLTPSALEKILSQKFKLERKQARALIKKLVAQGELTYIYEFGTTFIDISFNRPVRVSKTVVLKPPGFRYQAKKGEVVIQIKPGASFGSGQHPTTRLAIRGIEYTLKQLHPMLEDSQNAVLDIGTGSGILVLTAVSLGMQKGIGIDTDPVARAEAAENMKCNHLDNRIEIWNRSLESIHRCFGMITANLRVPTLKQCVSRLAAIIVPNGYVVVSGIKHAESKDMLDVYTANHFKCRWREEELDWVGFVWQRCN
jgi:ribosomal protein L11 methyltransferase